MLKSPYTQLDTPSLLIDRDIMLANLQRMQAKAQALGVALRPHTKTHKMPEIAQLQVKLGARGITVAKTGEAEVMADQGLKDIFIANEIVGELKWRRLAKLAGRIKVAFGIDSAAAVQGIERVFALTGQVANVRLEVETGENRSGVTNEAQLQEILTALKASPHVHLEGVFSHEGHAYGAPSVEACRKLFVQAQETTLHYAKLVREAGLAADIVSVGSTPSLMHNDQVLPGITEIRPGTYVFMDVGQGNCIGTYAQCAATVLVTVISKPAPDRVIGDAGAKALTAQSRGQGLCHTVGKGYIKGSGDARGQGGIYVDNVYDEHTIINSARLHDLVEIGDKIEIIPNHICPCCNLYDQAYLVSQGQVLKTLDIACRGKLQ